MPATVDKARINNEKLDKRVKLTQTQKEEIKKNEHGLSQRRLAAMYGVSRRTIQFILSPDKLKENKERRQERGGSKVYYDKDKHRESMKKHRKYKKELLDEGLIKINKDDKV